MIVVAGKEIVCEIIQVAFSSGFLHHLQASIYDENPKYLNLEFKSIRN